VITHFYALGISASIYTVILVRQYHKTDTELLNKVLLDECWTDVLLVDDINISTEAFTLIMQDVLNFLLP